MSSPNEEDLGPGRLVDPSRLAELLAGKAPPILIDVREPAEVSSGVVPGAVSVPLGRICAEIGALASVQKTVALCCERGVRSRSAAKLLQQRGYRDLLLLDGGLERWRQEGRPTHVGSPVSARYARQLSLPEVGSSGQERLADARVLIVGAGGLGSPAALYLAGAGVGTVGLVDHDRVDLSNLHRQVLHRTADVGTRKVDSGRRALAERNPEVQVETFHATFSAESAAELLGLGWDVVIDGSDRIDTRYAVNDAVLAAGGAVVHGAVHRFEGQVTLFAPGGPCYRCLFPEPPPTGAAPTCSEAGVFGPAAGVIGVLQAAEALRWVLGVGEPLLGRLLRYDGLGARFETIELPVDPGCPVCQSASPSGSSSSGSMSTTSVTRPKTSTPRRQLTASPDDTSTS